MQIKLFKMSPKDFVDLLNLTPTLERINEILKEKEEKLEESKRQIQKVNEILRNFKYPELSDVSHIMNSIENKIDSDNRVSQEVLANIIGNTKMLDTLDVSSINEEIQESIKQKLTKQLELLNTLINNKSEIDLMDLKSMDSIVENYKKLENERIKTLLSQFKETIERKKDVDLFSIKDIEASIKDISLQQNILPLIEFAKAFKEAYNIIMAPKRAFSQYQSNQLPGVFIDTGLSSQDLMRGGGDYEEGYEQGDDDYDSFLRETQRARSPGGLDPDSEEEAGWRAGEEVRWQDDRKRWAEERAEERAARGLLEGSIPGYTSDQPSPPILLPKK